LIVFRGFKRNKTMTVPSQAGRGVIKVKKKTREEENIRNINKESLIFV
jgi:hypothetical protein